MCWGEVQECSRMCAISLGNCSEGQFLNGTLGWLQADTMNKVEKEAGGLKSCAGCFPPRMYESPPLQPPSHRSVGLALDPVAVALLTSRHIPTSGVSWWCHTERKQGPLWKVPLPIISMFQFVS